MSDPFILSFVAICLLSITAVTARRAAVPFRRGGKRITNVPPLLAKRGSASHHRPYNHAGSQPQTPSKDAQRPISPPRVIRGSDYLQKGRWSHVKSFRVGREGEDLIAKQLENHLDGYWTIFRNLDLPDKAGDIDIVLVGPGGIFALEVKTYTGNYRVEGGRYYKETRAGYMARMHYGPGAQARTNAARLCTYLKKHGVVYWNSAQPVVVLAGDAIVEVISSGTEIWTLDSIAWHLMRLTSHKRFSQNHVEEIVRKLEAVPSNAINTLH